MSEALMLGKIEILKAQIGVLEDKDQTAQITIVTLQHKIHKLNMMIEHLKDECTDAYKAECPFKKARKENMMGVEIRELRMKIEDQRRALGRILKEKEESEANVRVHIETIEILEERPQSSQKAFAHIEHYSDEGWNNVIKCRESLAKAQEKEAQLWMRIRMLEIEKKQYEEETQQHEEWLKNW